jgi:2-haloacid dehalogenase
MDGRSELEGGVAVRGSNSGIIFDAYGTLFDVYAVASVAETMYPGHGAVLASIWRDKQMEYSRLRTLCDRYVDFYAVTEDALHHSCARLRLDLTDENCRRLMGQYLCLPAHPDALHTLQRLRSRGFSLAILSNGSAKMLEDAVTAGGMHGLFTHILSAERVRKFKTASEVYQLGVDAFHRRAEELVFVSSNGWDACCATWFGYRTFWVNRTGEPAERLGIVPNGEGRSLADLFGFLAED